MQASSALEKEINGLTAKLVESQTLSWFKYGGDCPLNVDLEAQPDELAWSFSGTTKWLEECEKDELLYVCQVLYKALQSKSTANTY